MIVSGGLGLVVSSPLNLVTDAWLPVRRHSGVAERAAPAGLTGGIEDDPIVAFAWSRPDFDAAAAELVIGLLATACAERLDRRGWYDWWEGPPTTAELAERLAPLAPFFGLDGDGPRFMQDLDPLDDGAEGGVAALLIDSPGSQTLEQNRDLFVKRRRVSVLGRSAAAMALFTLNAFAPAGGAGIRTSLRGGGPFTCLVRPEARDQAALPLWRVLWLNAVAPREAGERSDARFPWCLPTHVSKAPGSVTTPTDVDPLQVFWGMPRRTRLLFETNAEGLPCDLTGEVEPVVVRTYRSRPHGNNYKGWSQVHPLTPYYRTKATDTEWLPRHPQPGRLAYRDWVGLVVADAAGDDARVAPAGVVASARTRLREARAGDGRSARLVAAGYDMDNMKPRGFVESAMPVAALDEAEVQAAATLARRLVAGAEAAARLLSSCVRQALAAEAGDKGGVQEAKDRFWAETEAPFFALLERAARADTPEDEPTTRCQEWRKDLARHARSIFDEACPLDVEAPRGVEAVIAARRRLGLGLQGHGKDGRGLFDALGLSPSEPTGKAVGKGRKGSV
jgi:CRISPR system Cascade subunit CasA